MKRKKRKFLTAEEHREFESEEKMTFSTESPFSAIRSPDGIFWVKWWTKPFSGLTTGTALLVRSGDSPVKYDVDGHSLVPCANGSVEIRFFYPPYHHTNDLSRFLEEPIPPYIEQRINRE